MSTQDNNLQEEKITILFVDDEANIIQALKRFTVMIDEPWITRFAASGEEALNILAQMPVDVVVSDMRMPKMNGAELLTQVMQQYPDTIRMVLSGHADQNLILRAIKCTHQYLTKPFDPELLRQTIRRALMLRRTLRNESIRKVTSQMKSLPPIPKLYTQLTDKLEQADVTLREIGDLVIQDVSMTAKILQLVNSSFFGLMRTITDIYQALTYLGMDMLKALVLNVEVFSCSRLNPLYAQKIESLSTHSLKVANVARRIALTLSKDKKLAEEAFMGGILHEVGQLVCLQQVPQYAEVLDLVDKKQMPLTAAERTVLGTTHAIIGAYLLSVWGLPNNIVESVAFCEKPSELNCAQLMPLTFVHVAKVLVGFKGDCETETQIPGLDMAHLDALQITPKIGEWLQICRE